MSFNFKLEDFIPYYISPENEDDNIEKDVSIYNNIVLKKEFDELRLGKTDEVKKGELYKQQSFVSRFLSPNTLYDKLLVYHGIGTGKTCVISAITESAIQYHPNFRPTIILTRNPTLKNDVVRKIALSCTNDKYKPSTTDEKSGEEVDERTYRKRLQNSIKQAYKTYTFSMFAKEIKLMSDTMLKKEYNNRIIIIDEVHNIKSRVQTKEGYLNVYKIIHNFLHVVQGCKIALLTATPMKDQPSEIIDVMNLLLPLDKQLIKKEFVDKYMMPSGFNRELSTEFKNKYLSTLVSYVRSMYENIKVINEGIIDKSYNMKYTKTVLLEMNDLQNNVYDEVYKKDKGIMSKTDMNTIEIDSDNVDDVGEDNQNNLWLDSRHAAMFVFPDGSYGSEGEKKYLKSVGNSYKVSSELDKYIKKDGDNNKSKLKQLKNLSIKFHKIINDILENPTEKFFIYSNIVKGGGAHLFSAILQLFDFNHVDIPSRTVDVNINKMTKSKNRFILVTGGILTPAQTDLLVDVIFNSKENLYGDYARIIIGSHVVGEGKSFKHVKRVYILTPFWNSPTTEQAIGRAIRADSHTEFKNPEDRFVKVYRMAAMPQLDLEEESAESIDLNMYKVSEDKDIKVKSIERLLKESAVDCAINYERNVSSKDKPFSKECDYMEQCAYKCDYVDPKYYVKDWIGDRITDTYNLYYAIEELDNIKRIIKTAFKIKSAYDFYELYNMITKELTDMSNLVLSRALNDMILFNDGIRNKYGFVNYLREDRNLFFLTDDPMSSTLYTSYYYALHPRIETQFETFDEIIKNQQLLNYDETWKLLIDNENNPNTINSILNNLPRHNIFYLLKIFIFTRLTNVEEVYQKLQNILLQKYEKFIIDYPTYLLLIFDKHNNIKLSKTATSLDDWKELDAEETGQLKISEKENISRLKLNPFGYYAIISSVDLGNNNFKNLKIVRVREERLTRQGDINKTVESSLKGQTCGEGEFQFKGLIVLYYDFLMKIIELNKTNRHYNEPVIKIIKPYTVKELISDNKFKNYLKEHIKQEIEEKYVIDTLLSSVYNTSTIKETLIKILEKGGDKQEKKIIPIINMKQEFTYDTLKSIIKTMEKSRNVLIGSFNTVVSSQEEENKKIEASLDKLDIKYINMIGNAINLKSPVLCEIIKNWFIQNNLFINKMI